MSSQTQFIALCSATLIILARITTATHLEGGSYLRTEVDGSAWASDEDLSAAAWSYGCRESLKGPSHWGELSSDWATCSQGKSQSPILIQTGSVEASPMLLPLTFFPSAESSFPFVSIATVTSQDRVFQVHVGGWSMLLDDNIYKLVQIQFHTPAEHRIDGAIYPLEMQHEFISEAGDIVILSVFYKYSKNQNPYIGQYFQFFSLLKDQKAITNVSVTVNLVQEDLYPYYLYEGSIARPPCTEGVTWIIAQNVKFFSQSQHEALKGITKGSSNRPLQPMNGRKVYVPAY